MKKRGKRKKMSIAQQKAGWKNFAKMRVAGAVALRDLLSHKYAGSLTVSTSQEISNACQHLQWAIDRWEGKI